MDEKLSEIREWMAEWHDAEWDNKAASVLGVVLDEFDERFGA